MAEKIDHPALVDLLRRAYSGERAASFAYIGHAGSLRRREAERAAVRQIEEDEWEHRRQVKRLMDLYGIAPSRWYELKFYIIGKVVGLSCFRPLAKNLCRKSLFFGVGICSLRSDC